MSTKKKVLSTIGLGVLILCGGFALYMFISNICRIVKLYPYILGKNDLAIQLPPSIISLIFVICNIIVDIVIMVVIWKRKKT